MADDEKDFSEQMNKKTEELKGQSIDKYEELIDRLYEQRDNLRRELNREYRDARHYVRSNPEESMVVGLIGGFVVGVVFSRLFKS